MPYSPVQAIGLADGEVGWAAAGFSVYLTTDHGRTWHTVTPPGIRGQTITGVVGPMVGIGTRDLWLPVGNLVAPELIPASQLPDASVRVTGVEHSTDGGGTWAFSALPGCLQACGAIPSLSFVDAQHGYAAVGADASGTTRLFSTDDGGTTWEPRSELPHAGDGPSIVFSSVEDGWVVTGPTFGSYAQDMGQATDPGGSLFRTEDGGVTWSPVAGLPRKDIYELPTFFNARDGVMPGRAPGAPAQSPIVFVTDDGGTSWIARHVPAAAGGITARGSIAAGPPFAALSPTDWKLYVGPTLYTTNDAGASWQSIRPTPVARAGTVAAIAFSSRLQGMAMVQQPGCPASTTGGCVPVLMGTSDGGLHWRPLTLATNVHM
jgi:photosystem II stability/assembly factor-like uncharacterized protein